MKVFLTLSLLAVLCNYVYTWDPIVPSRAVYEKWLEFNFTLFEPESEYDSRFKAFRNNSLRIEAHNRLYEKGEASYRQEINSFADLDEEEFLNTYTGYRNATYNRTGGATYIRPHGVKLPPSKNWITLGAVTPVKNQGKCASCWAFSTTGSLEGQNFRKTGKLVSLSEQNLIDCSGWLGNFGCAGGEIDVAIQYVMSNDGIDTEDSYPYKGINDTCRYNVSQIGATAAGFMDIGRGNEDNLKAAVATMGPVSVVVNVKASFMSYSKGIYYEPTCSAKEEDLNHAMLVVGYGTDKNSNMDYWLVKNSWGTAWGLKGYAKMARNKGNNCGIATMASFPVV